MTQSPGQPPFPPQPIAYGYGSAPPPGQRANGPAIASLVLGILGCIPLLTGFLAIILGIVGIRKTRDPYVGGKGMAIAGLILGILSIIGWIGFGGAMWYAYVESQPARAVAQQFLQDMSTGNVANARANSGGFAPGTLESLSPQIAAFGTCQSATFTSFHLTTFNGQTTMNLGGTANFSSGARPCTVTLTKTGGVYKVISFWVQ